MTWNPGKLVTTRTAAEVQVSLYRLHVYFSGSFCVVGTQGSWPHFSLSAPQCHFTQDSKNNRISVFQVHCHLYNNLENELGCRHTDSFSDREGVM